MLLVKKCPNSSIPQGALPICITLPLSLRPRLRLLPLLSMIFVKRPLNTVPRAVLNRVGYTPEISHEVLVEMAEHRKELDRKLKPILDTLRSYQDLPPDQTLASLKIEDKKIQYAAEERRLEEVLQRALATTD
ncbi:AUGMIN subunit 1-like isoform X2 [Silene latifolia]|uniref:AUGMIN subunit 1-like isoform X2 n=1 Tax=Silene latifolia TaxID=37657 RepID=UPI003D77A165